MKASGTTPAARFVTQVVLAYGSELHRFLMRRLKGSADAADLAQEVYLRLLRLPRTDLIRKPQAYVYFVAAQIAAEHRMREQDRPLVYDSEALEHLTNEDAFARPDDFVENLGHEQELIRLLRKIPVTHRNVLILSKRNGLSIKEIATELELSPHTVKKYLYEATARIACFIKDR
jgi:RNA polymerase sigma-70 factor (ECF subfamily)